MSLPNIIVANVLLSAINLVSCSVTAGTVANTGSLFETGCYETKANGGWGYCGPASCKNNYITCPSQGGGPATVDGVTGTYTLDGPTQYSASNCQSFLNRTSTADKTDWDPKGQCTSSSTCTQQTTGVCSGTFLATVIKGTGLKYAYCNDKWLVIASSGAPSVFTPNLNDVPFPPGDSSGNYRTGMPTLDTTRTTELFYPLSVTALSTSTGTNNQAVYDTQTGAGAYSFLKDGNTVYGLPSDGASGMGVNGEHIFPIYNNNAAYTPEKCEVDSCSNHVGQGGGQPHLHGDPFGDQNSSTSSPDNCLYGPSDYADGTTGHPPIIGFSNDGYLIYGRYLSNTAPGFAAPLLDSCGGHGHTTASTDWYGFDLSSYHYHTQIFDATCGSGAKCTSGETYKATTTGPYQCFKADLTASEGSSALLVATTSATYKTKDEMSYRCCGMTDYYIANDVTLSSSDVASSSTCSSPAAPANGAYASGSLCTTAGSTLYSGQTCTATCNSGYTVSGTTSCIKGTLTQATCVATATTAAGTGTTTAGPTAAATTAATATTAAGVATTAAGATATTAAAVATTTTAAAVATTVAAPTTQTVTGSLTLGVSDTAAVTGNNTVKTALVNALKTQIATQASVLESNVAVTVTSAGGRRLALERELASGDLTAAYTITTDSNSASTVSSNLQFSSSALTTIRTAATSAMTSVGASVTVSAATVATAAALVVPTTTATQDTSGTSSTLQNHALAAILAAVVGALLG